MKANPQYKHQSCNRPSAFRIFLASCLLPSAFCLLLSAFCLPADAADTWSMTGADLGVRPVTLKSFGPGGVTISAPDGSAERVIALEEFVELQRTLAAPTSAAKFVVYLTTGDEIRGEPIGVRGEAIVWKNPTAGEIDVPLRQLRAIAKPGVRISDEPRKEDVVTLANKDTVRGTIAGLTAEKVSLQSETGATDLPLASVESIGFAAVPGAAVAEKGGFRIRLDDGSSIVAESVKIAADKMEVSAGKGAARPMDLSHVAAIEQIGGPVSWLSSRVPSENIYTPFLGSDSRFPARMNATLDGQPITFKDRTYRRGIAVHAYSRLSFPLDGKAYTAFRTRFAIDPGTDNDRADVTVRIKVGDKIAYEQEHVRPGVLSPAVVVDLGDAKSITLEVDYGANFGFGGRLNWIEPALLKVKPAPEPEPLPATTEPAAPTTAPTTEPAAPGSV
jgi:hypothetical protein